MQIPKVSLTPPDSLNTVGGTAAVEKGRWSCRCAFGVTSWRGRGHSGRGLRRDRNLAVAAEGMLVARAQDLAANVGELVESGADITIDLTTAVGDDGAPHVTVTLPEVSRFEPAAAGGGRVGQGGEALDSSRLAQPGVLAEEIPLPKFVLGEHDAAAASGLSLAPLYRFLDIVIAGVLLLVLTPLMLVAAIAVKADTPGPVLYRHRRFGRNGKAIGVMKFRSMVVDADRRIEEARQAVAAQDGAVVDAPTFKSADDPRITRVGRFLRRSGIDEIPQLFNVIAGQMSVVGPRPLVADEVAMLSTDQAKLRHSVRPGITCLWQVFRTETTSFSDRMQLDLLYVNRRSLLLYLTLVVITPLALFRGRGAF